jgi:hypothetical protein
MGPLAGQNKPNRRRYLHWLFEAEKRCGLSVLNYMVRSNHVHLLVCEFKTFKSFNRFAPFKTFERLRLHWRVLLHKLSAVSQLTYTEGVKP